ncbi:MAG: 6-phosphofructokinase [Anaerolineales bacterium]|jgi:6-phosphofructokinase
MKTLAILTNGGDSCALNASIKSIRDHAYKAGYKKIYGIRRGYQGLVDGWIEDITDKEIDPTIGGSCLGSLRVSPTDPCSKEERVKTGHTHKINEARCEEMARCVSDYRIDVLVVIGGDGTLQATRMFQEWVHQKRASREFRLFEIVGFLKTIDNDIRTFTNFQGVEVSLCPGFPSAVKKVVSCVEGLRVTVRTAERAFCVETMGRDAGWLAAAATYGGAEILLVPEHMELWDKLYKRETKSHRDEVSNQIMESLVDTIIHFYQKNRNVLVAVAEGFEPVVEIDEVEDFRRVIADLYGPRKKVGATELVTMLVSPVLEYYFRCLSNLCVEAYDTVNMSDVIKKVLTETKKSPIGEKYKKKVDDVDEHPLKGWKVKARLQDVLELKENKTQAEEDTPKKLQDSCLSEEGRCKRSPLTVPPYKFEIRPHRTDYLPRSGSPSSYDYKLATVLGRKVGEMLLEVNREFGAVPALEQVVPYDKLTLNMVKTVRIEEIRTLNFNSIDYFDRDFPLQVSKRITDFFRTIMTGPDNLDEAIREMEK